MAFCNRCGSKLSSDSRFCQECGAPKIAVSTPHLDVWETHSHTAATAIPMSYETTPPKSVAVAVALAGIFGPLGLLYSSVSGALYMFLAWCFLVLATCEDWISNDTIPILIVWPICMAWAVLATRAFNESRR